MHTGQHRSTSGSCGPCQHVLELHLEPPPSCALRFASANTTLAGNDDCTAQHENTITPPLLHWWPPPPLPVHCGAVSRHYTLILVQRRGSSCLSAGKEVVDNRHATPRFVGSGHEPDRPHHAAVDLIDVIKTYGLALSSIDCALTFHRVSRVLFSRSTSSSCAFSVTKVQS